MLDPELIAARRTQRSAAKSGAGFSHHQISLPATDEPTTRSRSPSPSMSLEVPLGSRARSSGSITDNDQLPDVSRRYHWRLFAPARPTTTTSSSLSRSRSARINPTCSDVDPAGGNGRSPDSRESTENPTRSPSARRSVPPSTARRRVRAASTVAAASTAVTESTRPKANSDGTAERSGTAVGLARPKAVIVISPSKGA